MRAKVAGVVNITVLLTILSGLLNLVRVYYNIKFYRS